MTTLLGCNINNDQVKFIKLKDNGCLIVPSKGIITSCKLTETLLKHA